VPSENLIRWIRSRKENRIMIETDGDLLQTSERPPRRVMGIGSLSISPDAAIALWCQSGNALRAD